MKNVKITYTCDVCELIRRESDLIGILLELNSAPQHFGFGHARLSECQKHICTMCVKDIKTTAEKFGL